MLRIESPCRLQRLFAAALVATANIACAAEPLTMAPGIPEDQLLDQAIEHHEHGHPVQAAVVSERLALAGNVVAMERLALMHWYGKALYSDGPWNREHALYWFIRASELGSDVGRHMAQVAQRALAKGG